ncbi:MAG: 50S ribosomal protein L25/general stress protein Ctc [Pseudohongiellaceae bacterium]
MSNAFELNAKVRTDLGKGASRRLRRLNNEIPAIIYGGHKEPTSITLLHKDIAHAVENESFFSHIITLNIGSNPEQVIIKALQRHPARPIIMHADFQRVSADEEITVNVPVHFLNEDKCIGVKVGHGNIIHALTEIEIVCLPKDLPEYLEIDMANVDLGESVHISDIKFPNSVQSVALSHGVESANLAVASVLAPKGPSEDEVADAAKAEEAAKASADAVAAKTEKKEE